jgi:hypothetical protein
MRMRRSVENGRVNGEAVPPLLVDELQEGCRANGIHHGRPAALATSEMDPLPHGWPQGQVPLSLPVTGLVTG